MCVCTEAIWSLLGKIHILKMAILRFFFFFSNMFPLSLLRNASLEYNEAVYNFLGAGKKKPKT